MPSQRHLRAAGALLGAAVLTSACGSAATAAPSAAKTSAAQPAVSAPKLRTVTLNLGWSAEGWMLPFAYGVKQGIFKRYGINMELEPGTGSETTVESVANRQRTFGLADASTLTALHAKGVDAMMVCGYIQKSAIDVVVTKKSGITSPKQLAGKPLAVTPTGPTYEFLPAFLKNVGLPPNAIKEDHMSGSARIPAVVGGRVVGEVGFGQIEDGPVIASEGVPVRYFPYANYGVDAAETEGLITSPAEVQQHPGLVGAVVKATLASIRGAQQHPRQAAADMAALFPSTAPKPSVMIQQFDGALRLLRTPADQGHPLGWMAPGDWKTSVDLAEKYLGVKGPVNPASLYTNRFVLAASGQKG